MHVAEKHGNQAFPFVVVPKAFSVRVASVGMPDPIALNDLVGGASGDLARFDRYAVGRPRNCAVRRRVLHTEPIHGPHRKITIAPASIARWS